MGSITYAPKHSQSLKNILYYTLSNDEVNIMQTVTNETITWKRTLDGLYHTTFPKHMTVKNLVTMWAEIFNDYSEHFAGGGPLLIIADGSHVEQYDDEAISIASLHVIPGNTEALVAIHSRSPQYVKSSNDFFRTHIMPQNMRYFENESEAKIWLSKTLDKYNRSLHF